MFWQSFTDRLLGSKRQQGLSWWSACPLSIKTWGHIISNQIKCQAQWLMSATSVLGEGARQVDPQACSTASLASCWAVCSVRDPHPKNKVERHRGRHLTLPSGFFKCVHTQRHAYYNIHIYKLAHESIKIYYRVSYYYIHIKLCNIFLER